MIIIELKSGERHYFHGANRENISVSANNMVVLIGNRIVLTMDFDMKMNGEKTVYINQEKGVRVVASDEEVGVDRLDKDGKLKRDLFGFYSYYNALEEEDE